MSSINLPYTIKKINDMAFASCTGLTEIVLHGGISIGKYILDDSYRVLVKT